ncbi:MAG: MiaB/RimO family radical SAM methylthiotransferase [Elusimicrobiota bacterium]
MKLHTISFGCQMSAADCAEMSRPWLRRGFSRTRDLDDADAVIVSTCTVRQHAEDRAVSQIGRLRAWKERRPGRYVVVAGCAAERIGAWIARRFPHVDLVVGARSIERYPEILDEALRRRYGWGPEDGGCRNEAEAFHARVPRAGTSGAEAFHSWVPRAGTSGAAPGGAAPSEISSFVTIMRGCNYRCTYCIVPSVRGRETYHPLETVLDEVRSRVAGGAREVFLLGQTVNSYRDPKGRDFADLLRAVGDVDGVSRVRFTSAHPFHLDDRMMRAMAECSGVVPHLHLPVQSGSDRILKAMRRGYTVRDYLDKISALRVLIPDLALSTDIIAGFPGETADDFAATLRLVGEADFCAAYCTAFSPRAGTEAADMGPAVPAQERARRLRRLLAVVEDRTRVHLEGMAGQRVRILLETPTDGRTQYHFRARLDEAKPDATGRIVEAEVIGRSATALKCSPTV